jgi:DnaJ domain
VDFLQDMLGEVVDEVLLPEARRAVRKILKSQMSGLPGNPGPGQGAQGRPQNPQGVGKAPKAAKAPGKAHKTPQATYYRLLGVAQDAEQEVVAAAYKALSRRYHPDNQETGNAARMRVLNAAYEVVGDKVKRSEYDKWLKSQR